MAVEREGQVFENADEGFLVVGDTGPGALRLSQGAVFTPEVARGPYVGIGQNPGGAGSVTVTGAGSRLDLQGAGTPDHPLGLQLGRRGGDGELEIRDGGALAMREPAAELVYVRIGTDPDSRGTALLAEGAALEIAGGREVQMDIGQSGGTGSLTLTSGASATLQGAGPDHNSLLRVGRGPEEGSSGRLEISDGAELQMQDARDAWMLIGSEGGTGAVVLDDGRLELEGGRGAGIRLGEGFAQPGSGRLTLQDGAEVALRAPQFAELRAGGGAGADGALEVLSGARLDLGGRGYLALGRADDPAGAPAGGSGRLTLDGAGSRIEGVYYVDIGRDGGNGTAEIGDEAWLRIGAPDVDDWTGLNLGRGDGSSGALQIDRALVTVVGANGRRPEGEGWEAYVAIGRDGGSGSLTLLGDRADDPEARHGLVQTAGGESPFATIDIGRGAGAVGEAVVRGALLATRNIGSTTNAETGAPIDLPGDGGQANLRIGLDRGEGRLTAEAGAEIRVESGLANGAGFNVGTGFGGPDFAGHGRARFDDSTLIVRSEAWGAFVTTGNNGGDGRLELEGGSRVVMEGGTDPDTGGLLFLTGDNGGTGSVTLRGAGTGLEGRSAAFGRVMVGGEGGDGRLEIADAAGVEIVTGGFQGLWVGNRGGTGDFALTGGAHYLARTTGRDEGQDSYLLVGTEGGTGTALIDGARLDLVTDSPWAGIRVAALWSFTEDSSGTGTLSLRNDARVTIEAARTADMRIGGGRDGHGTVEVLSGATIDFGDNGYLALGSAREGQPGGGSGRLTVAGAGSRIDGLLEADVGRFGGFGTLEVAEGGFLGVSETLRAGAADGSGLARLLLDGGTIAAGEVRLEGGVLAGSGLLGDAAGVVTLHDSALHVGDTAAADEGEGEGDVGLASGFGTLRIAGDMVQTGGRAAFEIDMLQADQLVVGGALRFEGTQIALDWLGEGAPDSGGVLLARAEGGILLDDVALQATGLATPAALELRAGDTELWAVLEGTDPGPGSALAGQVAGRDGAALEGVTLRFAAEGMLPVTAQSDAAGGFALELPADAEGRLLASRELAAGDPQITTASALEALRLAVGLAPSWGPATPADFIAADIDGDGQVSTADSLDILRLAVGVPAPAPRWVFLDSDADLSAIERGNVQFEPGVALPLPQGEASLTGILVGHVQEYP